jgi:hypothetical protein
VSNKPTDEYAKWLVAQDAKRQAEFEARQRAAAREAAGRKSQAAQIRKQNKAAKAKKK